MSTTTHADATLAKWLERHGRGSEVESTHVGDLPERREAGRDERPSNPDTTDITTPPFSHNVAGLPGMIDQRSAELGLHTPAQRALESSLFIDEPAHQVALLSRYPRPELTFGERDWAGYLDARAFARHYGDQELTVPFMTELHRRISQFTKPHIGGVTSRRRRVALSERPFTDRELAAFEANPYLEHMPQGTVPLWPDYSAVEYRIPPKAIEGELQALSDWYNVDRKLPGTDPYQLAAELQRRYISIHPWGDYNGSSSRILMNWSLENHELPPSALSDFEKDIFSTTGEWTDMVRAGSDAFGERANRLEHLGVTADPIEVFGLEREHSLYQAHGHQLSDFWLGGIFDIEKCRMVVEGLRGSQP
ncbi:Fic family protein [Nocardia sp. NPDC051911]|uniref:Fic family protein n=1 Tax=Nocardia sp. NPDC051911 TaxID=3154648 RepID=UPI00344AF4B5